MKYKVFFPIVVINQLGAKIETITNQQYNQGIYKLQYDGSGLPAGIYYYKLGAEGFSETKRMIILH